MADTRYLKLRNQSWFFQLAVPRAIREAYGSDVISVTLGTRDIAVAQQRRWAKLVEYQDAFAKLSGGRAPEPNIEISDATLAKIDEIAVASYHAALIKMERNAREGKPIRALIDGASSTEQELEGLSLYTDNLSEALEYGDLRPIASVLAEAAADAGSDFVPNSEAYTALGRALLKAYCAAAEGRMAALRGEPSEHPKTFVPVAYVDPVSLAPVRATVKVGGAGLRFSEAAARFIAELQRDETAALTEQTRAQHEAVFRLFGDFVHDAPLKAIDRAAASEFLDKVARLHPDWGRSPETKKLTFIDVMKRHADKGEGLSNKTLNRYVSSLTSLFKWARKRGYVDEASSNPFTEQSRPKARKGTFEWLPYTVDELNSIFQAPIFQTPHDECIKPKVHSVETALRWVPLIALFSGMRLNEICQLKKSDIRFARKIWFFNVSEEAEGTRLKTEAAVRRVPLHGELLNCGLIAYRNSLSDGPLFPGLKPGGPDSKHSWYFTRRYTVFRRDIGIVRPRVSFHSFRKNVTTALDNARVPQSDVAAIIGHERGFTFDTYSAGLDLPALQSIVDQIQFDGLNISHLYAL